MKPKRIHRQILCDPATLTRLTWIRAVLRNQYRMTPAESGPSVIMKRALEAYTIHLERILKLPDGHDDPTRDRDLAQGLERSRLRSMGGDRDLGITEETAASLPLRPLSDYMAERAAALPATPSVMDFIRKELQSKEKRDAIRRKAIAASNPAASESDPTRDAGTHVA